MKKVYFSVPSIPTKVVFAREGLLKSKNHRYLKKSQTVSPKGVPNPPKSVGNVFPKALKTRSTNVF